MQNIMLETKFEFSIFFLTNFLLLIFIYMHAMPLRERNIIAILLKKLLFYIITLFSLLRDIHEQFLVF